MRESVAAALLELNQEFYKIVAASFNMTRMAHSPGKERLLAYAPTVGADHPLRVADIGCGNGRLGWMLDELARPVDYVGVDADARLLAAAKENTAGLTHVRCRFVEADLAEPGWQAALQAGIGPDARYEMVACLATLQHMPGFALRARIVGELASLLAPDGLLIISAWQFMESERLRTRLLDWASIDIDPAEVEPGDALLPWKQDVYAIRYVHQIDLAEIRSLADAANLQIIDTYRADGREGNLNVYCVLRAA